MKEKCQNCKNCKMIYRNGKVICEYLNELGGIYRPKYCPKFKTKEKDYGNK